MAAPIITRALTTGLRTLRVSFDQAVMQVDAGRRFDALNPSSYTLWASVSPPVELEVASAAAVSAVCVDLTLAADFDADITYQMDYAVADVSTRQVGIVTSVDVGGDRLVLPEHGLVSNEAIWIDAVGAAVMPAPLVAGWPYYASIDDNDDIFVMPAPDSAPLDLTTAGSGTRVVYAGTSPLGLARTVLVEWNDPALFDDLLAWLRGSLPRRLWERPEGDVITRAIARGIVPAYQRLRYWRDQAYLLTSESAWLDQHARDRGTWRQHNETDPGLAARLRTPQDALTKPVLLDAITTILTSYGLSWTPSMIELPHDGAYTKTMAVRAFSGCTLTPQGDGTVVLTAAALGFFCGSEADLNEELVVTAATGGSGHTGVACRIVEVLSDTSVRYANAAATGTATGAAGSLNHSGRQCSYVSRRRSLADTCVIVILPAGTTAPVIASVREMLRQRKAAGVQVQIAQVA